MRPALASMQRSDRPRIIQRSPFNATLVEFVHRLTSGIALVSVLVLAAWAFRAFPRDYGVRSGALLALASTLIECAIGAALVLLRLVGSDESLSRGLWLAAHLTNTLFLLAALSITAWQATAVPTVSRPCRCPRSRRITLELTIGGFLISAGILGTFAALGDTLAVSTSLAEGLPCGFLGVLEHIRETAYSPSDCSGGAGSLAAGARLGDGRFWSVGRACKTPLRLTIAMLVAAQFALGIANIVLLAPAWLQLLSHLLGADLLWDSRAVSSWRRYSGGCFLENAGVHSKRINRTGTTVTPKAA